MEKRSQALITNTSARKYFHQAVTRAVAQREARARNDTIAYLVNLLTFYVRADRFYEHTSAGPDIRPLALIFGEAVNARTQQERFWALRRLGDLSLFVAGVFAGSLARKPVDVEYYISFGGTAYASLCNSCPSSVRGPGPGVYSELAEKFSLFVDVLGEASERTPHNDADLLRLYRHWLDTGSARSAKQLQAAGISLAASHASSVRH